MLTIYIFVVSRYDLLEKAVLSVLNPNVHVIVIDNSECRLSEPLMRLDKVNKEINGKVCPLTLYFSTVKMNFTETHQFAMNHYMNHVANNSSWYVWMHNDGELVEHEGIDKLIEAMRYYDQPSQENGYRKVGVLFTNYDVLCCIHKNVISEIGTFDHITFNHYFSDNDYYRRVRSAGYECVDTNIAVLHNEPSNTINSTSERIAENARTFGVYEQKYIEKWGGNPGNEKYTYPWNDSMKLYVHYS